MLFVEGNKLRQTPSQSPYPLISPHDDVVLVFCSLSISTISFSLCLRDFFGVLPLVCWNEPKAMTTKGVMRESKSDVCAWLSKAIFLHEGLPEMCNDRGAPELLGGERATCASSAFLTSLTALLLRMGAGKFSSLGAKVCRLLYAL